MPVSLTISVSRTLSSSDSARIQAGCRLVETEQYGIRAHRSGDLKPALGTVGQVPGRIVGSSHQIDLGEPTPCLLDRRAFGAGVDRKAEQSKQREAGCAHQGVVLGHHQILENGHAGKQAHVLERASDSRALGDAKIEQPFQQKFGAVRMHEADHALARLVKAGNAIEYGSLAGAIRADDRGDFAAARCERKVLDRDETAEAHGEMLHVQQNAGGVHLRASSTISAGITLRSRRCTEGTRRTISPRGRQTMMATMLRPNTSIRYSANSRKNSNPPTMITAATATPSWDPDSAQHDDGGDRRGFHEDEGLRTDESLTRCEEPAGDAAEHRSDREGGEFRVRRVYPKRAAGDFIFAKCLPCAADGQPAQADRHEIRQQCERKDHVEQEYDAVAWVEFQTERRRKSILICGERDSEEGRPRNAGDAVRSARKGLPVDQDDADDLAEREGHDREIVAAQAQDGKAEQDSPERRENSRERQA